MVGITLAQAQAQLDAYLAAETAVLSGQKYEIAGRVLQRADLQVIQAGIDTWNRRVKELAGVSAGRSRIKTPRVGF